MKINTIFFPNVENQRSPQVETRGYFWGIFISVLCLFSFNGQAQTVAEDSVAVINESILVESVVDSTVSGALIQERLQKIQKSIPLVYHKITNQFVDFFTYRKPYFTKKMLEKKDIYFPIYERLLKKYGLPDELKYLSMIESGLDSRAISYAGAAGLWQFMPATGREFGLKQDDYFDERFNPEKATEASCRYMKQLYRIFGDWEMVLAAYNTGPGNVKRAMRRTGGNTFWGIFEALPKQTRHYVPQYVAITYMMHYHADHGIFPENPEYPTLTDTVQVSGYFNLYTFAKLSGFNLIELYKHNPQIINTELPAQSKDYVLNVPSQYFEFINSNRTAIWDSASKLPFDPTLLLAQSDSTAKAGTLVGGIVAASDDTDDPETIVARKPQKLVHKVKRNETISSISARYGIDPYNLKRWNKIRGNKLLKGTKLIVYKENTKKKLPNRILVAKKIKLKLRFHKVHRGDTLFTICQRYGVDMARLKKLNRLRTNTVKAGQKLRIS